MMASLDRKETIAGHVAATADGETIVEEILRFNADRRRALVKLKMKRMAASAFAFFRGTDHLFARQWPDFKPTDVGPALLLCGDLHLENFGAQRCGDGVLRYDINDFDEAAVAPASFDLVRCAASTLLAAEEWQLSSVPATTILWAFLDSYRGVITATAATGQPAEATRDCAAGSIAKLLGAAALGTQQELLAKKTKINKDGQRRIIRSDDKHPAVEEPVAAQVAQAVEEFGAARDQAKQYKVWDVTERVAGIGSLGVPRYLVLVAGSKEAGGNQLLDVKEQRSSSIRAVALGPQPDYGGDEAQRVVAAQRQLQACPPEPLAAISIGRGRYRLREMVPEENRSGLDRLAEKPKRLREAVEWAGRLTGWAHWRGLSAGHCDCSELVDWATGPGLEAAVPAAIRCAAQAVADYKVFAAAYQDGLRIPKN
ncbi:MAG: DUF2252 family protein [Singulisphaera sp.]